MTTANILFNHHQILSYVLLTFIISWGTILCIVGLDGLPASSEEDKQAMGVGLLLGPLMATVIMTAVLDGREGFRQLLSRATLRHLRGDIVIGALLAPISSIATLLLLSTFVSEEFTPKIFTATNKSSLVITGISVGLVIATFEEVGWSGWAVPRLLQLTHSVSRTGIITGLIWGLWHFPIFWDGDTFSSRESLFLLLGRLFSWIVAFRVIMVWLYNRTRSLAVMVLMHASLVVCVIAIEPPLKKGTDLLTYMLSWTVMLWLVIWVGARIQHVENVDIKKENIEY